MGIRARIREQGDDAGMGVKVGMRGQGGDGVKAGMWEQGRDTGTGQQGSTNLLARRPGLAQSDVGLAGKVHSVPDGLVEFLYLFFISRIFSFKMFDFLCTNI